MEFWPASLLAAYSGLLDVFWSFISSCHPLQQELANFVCREPDSSLGFRHINLFVCFFSLTSFEKYKNHFNSQVEQKLVEGWIGPHSYAAGVPP